MLNKQVWGALPFAVYSTDEAGRLTYYNDAAVEFWGRRPELGCGLEGWGLRATDGSELPYDRSPMAISLREGHPVRGQEVISETSGGKLIPFIPYPTPMRDEAGEIIGAVNVLVDISERVASHAGSSLSEAIIASSDDAIVSKTLEGRVTTWNAAAERIFGYTAQEMIGTPIARLIPKDLLAEEERILASLARGEPIDHYETIRVAKDGRKVNVSLSVSPVRDRYGRVVGAAKVARDITERKNAESLQRMLVNELNHRIKNTLATVQAIATQTLRTARDSSEFTTSFLGRVQALGRAHAILTQTGFIGADVSELVRSQVLLGGASDERISCAGPMVILEAQSSVHLALVLHELGTNARKHGALQPHGRLSVTWSVHTNGGRSLLLQWSERGGPPIAAPSRRGFGTMLIEQSLQAHGGNVSMQYRAEGLVCTISLPLVEVPMRSEGLALNLIPQPNIQSRRSERPALKGKRVAIIEDEPLVSMDITATLADAGCIVIGPALTLAAARDLIDGGQFDAALLDANLSGEPVDSLAAALTRRNVPFAFVTGFTRDALPVSFKEAVVVAKPFNTEELLGVVERLLSGGGAFVRLRPAAS